MKDKKKEGDGRGNGGKTDTKHGDIAIFNSQPSMSLYEQGRTWRQRVDRAYTQTPPFPVVFPDLCVCVCVCARLLLSLHHDFEYAWLDVLPRRCCSKNSTVIFDFRRGEKIFLLFFLFSPIRRRGGARREYRDGRMKGKKNRSTPSCNIVRRSPRWDTPCMAQFWVLCLLFRFILSSNNVLMEPFNPRIFVSWKICIQSLRGVEFDIRYILRKSDPIIQLFACICVF